MLSILLLSLNLRAEKAFVVQGNVIYPSVFAGCARAMDSRTPEIESPELTKHFNGLREMLKAVRPAVARVARDEYGRVAHWYESATYAYHLYIHRDERGQITHFTFRRVHESKAPVVEIASTLRVAELKRLVERRFLEAPEARYPVTQRPPPADVRI